MLVTALEYLTVVYIVWYKVPLILLIQNYYSMWIIKQIMKETKETK